LEAEAVHSAAPSRGYNEGASQEQEKEKQEPEQLRQEEQEKQEKQEVIQAVVMPKEVGDEPQLQQQHFQENEKSEKQGQEEQVVEEQGAVNCAAVADEPIPEKNQEFISVVPGLDLPLRGSEETIKAIGKNATTIYPCMVCSLVLHSVEDVDYVLCPACQTVSPTERSSCIEGGGGVGLGFTQEQYELWSN